MNLYARVAYKPASFTTGRYSYYYTTVRASGHVELFEQIHDKFFNDCPGGEIVDTAIKGVPWQDDTPAPEFDHDYPEPEELEYISTQIRENLPNIMHGGSGSQSIVVNIYLCGEKPQHD